MSVSVHSQLCSVWSLLFISPKTEVFCLSPPGLHRVGTPRVPQEPPTPSKEHSASLFSFHLLHSEMESQRQGLLFHLLTPDYITSFTAPIVLFSMRVNFLRTYFPFSTVLRPKQCSWCLPGFHTVGETKNLQIRKF